MLQKSHSNRASVKAWVLGLTAYLIGVHFWTWVLFGGIFIGGRSDFRQLYTGGYLIRSGQGHKLYDLDVERKVEDELVSRSDLMLPVNHLAYEELLFVPISALRFHYAYLAFLVFNTYCLAFCYLLLRPELGQLGNLYWWLPAASFLAFLPIAAALIQGQDSILFLLLEVASFVALKKQNVFIAGVLLGCGFFKFQLVLPIAALFLIWYEWRFVLGVTASSLTALLVSLKIVGLDQMKLYARGLLAMSTGLASQADQLKYGISPLAMGNLRGLIYGLGHSRISHFSLQCLTLVISVVFFASAARSRPSRYYELAIVTACLVSYHLFIHDMSALILPTALAIDQSLKATTIYDKITLAVTTAICLSPLLVSYAPAYFYFACLPLIGVFIVLRTDVVTFHWATPASNVMAIPTNDS